MKLTEYEKRILASLPDKALTFLRTVAIKGEIRAELFRAGFSSAEQALGWRLVAQATGSKPGVGPIADDLAARAAIAELDQWDEPGFQRIQAALGRLHPEQRAFVFAGLDSSTGAGSVLAVATLLDRLDQLETGPDRAATRDADQAALATLAGRGITADVRAHLRDLVRIAQAAEAPDPTPSTTAAEREAALIQLRSWYQDWSQTARAVIHRRDHRMMLGLTRRRAPASDDDTLDDIVPVVMPATAPAIGAEPGPGVTPAAPGAATGATS